MKGEGTWKGACLFKLPTIKKEEGRMKKMSYLLLYVFEGVRGVDGEADENDVGVGVGERAEAIVILLTSGIPQGEFDSLAVDLHVCDVVLEDRRDVDLSLYIVDGKRLRARARRKTTHLWERALAEDDEKTGLVIVVGRRWDLWVRSLKILQRVERFMSPYSTRRATSTHLSTRAIADDDELPADDILSTTNVGHDGRRLVGLKKRERSCQSRRRSNTGRSIASAPMAVAAVQGCCGQPRRRRHP